MSFLDSIVGRSFRDEKAGRVVVFGGDRPGRGYLVRSAEDERKIRSFLKMFLAAQVSILVLGYCLASEWSRELDYALGRPALHMYRTVGIYVGIYSVVVGLPYMLVWRSYKKAFRSFVSAQDEVSTTGNPPNKPQLLIGASVMAFAILILLGVILLVRFK
jgi:hypothetical protein